MPTLSTSLLTLSELCSTLYLFHSGSVLFLEWWCLNIVQVAQRTISASISTEYYYICSIKRQSTLLWENFYYQKSLLKGSMLALSECHPVVKRNCWVYAEPCEITCYERVQVSEFLYRISAFYCHRLMVLEKQLFNVYFWVCTTKKNVSWGRQQLLELAVCLMQF